MRHMDALLEIAYQTWCAYNHIQTTTTHRQLHELPCPTAQIVIPYLPRNDAFEAANAGRQTSEWNLRLNTFVLHSPSAITRTDARESDCAPALLMS